MDIDSINTAVVIDPQNDVLSPTGKNWEVPAASVTENNRSATPRRARDIQLEVTGIRQHW